MTDNKSPSLPEKVEAEIRFTMAQHNIEHIFQFTCYTCMDNDICRFAWDIYNLHSKCLMEK